MSGVRPDPLILADDSGPRPSLRARAHALIPSYLQKKNYFADGKEWRSSRMRHALGITLLLVTVVLWTTSNFLASNIFADNSYSKPFFVTYINTSFFIIPLVPILLRHAYRDGSKRPTLKELWGRKVGRQNTPKEMDAEEAETFLQASQDESRRESSGEETLVDGTNPSQERVNKYTQQSEAMTLGETAKLSLEFAILWFLANYFTAACLEYTTVASSTILTSTSSIWTLLVGSAIGVEIFTIRKLLGVLASLAGIVLISMVDISGSTDKNRGKFPHKSTREIAIGDALAFLSAVMYGFYAVIMKKRIGDEGRVNMPLFFALVGLFNVVFLWPGLVILHYTKVEEFALPPTRRVLFIVLANSLSSLVSDYCWAYAMLLTSPLIVTVGLSLTIPLSLVGQMILESQYSSALYWVGAGIVFLSFIFVNREEGKEEAHPEH